MEYVYVDRDSIEANEFEYVCSTNGELCYIFQNTEPVTQCQVGFVNVTKGKYIFTW